MMVNFNKFRLRLIWLLATGLLWIAGLPVATGASAPKRVLVIDLPRFTFEDLTPRYPNLMKLANESSVGIMTTYLSGSVNPEKLYLNLSSGKQLWSYEEARLILNSAEVYHDLPAGKLYQSLTGYRAPAQGAVYLGLPKIMQLNAKKEPDPNIGAVGAMLHSNGLKTAVIGNADTMEYLNRSGAIPWVDRAGLIDLAAVGPETLAPDPAFPSGVRSDTGKIFTYWRQFSPKARVISISLGDLERIERYRDYFTGPRRQYFRNQALRSYDRLIGRIMAEVDPAQTMVVLYSILAPEVEGRGQRLNPVLIKSAFFKPGLITANSTRRVGLLTGADLMAAIFTFLELKNQDIYIDRSLRSVSGSWPQAATMLNELDLNYQARWDLLPIHGYALIISVLAVTAGLIYWPRQRRFFEIVRQIYLFLITIPAVCLIVALPNPVDWPAIIGWTVGLAGFFYIIVRLLSRNDAVKAILTIAGVTALLIIIDGLGNGWLELRSFWGYSAVSAARFYGVGNEYLGFLLGAYLVVVTLTIGKVRRYRVQLLWGGWVLLALFLFCPSWGANIGGGITVVLGLGIANFIWLDQRVTKKRIGLLLGALVGLLTLVGVVDLIRAGPQMSHFGQFIRFVSQQGLPALTKMMSRKWQFNQSLITANGWSYVLIGLLMAILLLYKEPPQVVRRWQNTYPEIAKGVLSLAVTSVIALLANDSGIVTVATMFIFGVGLFLVVISRADWPAS
ncbi:MAG: hypothetical protein PVG90_00355 [Bacillota bacterium]|jgi:hypothetical protein